MLKYFFYHFNICLVICLTSCFQQGEELPPCFAQSVPSINEVNNRHAVSAKVNTQTRRKFFKKSKTPQSSTTNRETRIRKSHHTARRTNTPVRYGGGYSVRYIPNTYLTSAQSPTLLYSLVLTHIG